MKKLLLALILLPTVAFCSTINWRLFTADRSRSIDLKNTAWASSIDGEKICFTSRDGSGFFVTTKQHFEYHPTIYSGAVDEFPDEMGMYNGDKRFNTIKLSCNKAGYYLTDKRGIKYFPTVLDEIGQDTTMMLPIR